MGFVRKVTGQQAAVDAANRQADEQRRALEQSSRAQASALAQQAASAARSTAMQVQRDAAQARFSDALNQNPDSVDVQLDDPAASGGRRGRRAVFGVGSASGVRI